MNKKFCDVCQIEIKNNDDYGVLKLRYPKFQFDFESNKLEVCETCYEKINDQINLSIALIKQSYE